MKLIQNGTLFCKKWLSFIIDGGDPGLVVRLGAQDQGVPGLNPAGDEQKICPRFALLHTGE